MAKYTQAGWGVIMNNKEILANNLDRHQCYFEPKDDSVNGEYYTDKYDINIRSIADIEEIEALKDELAKEKKYISDSIDASEEFNLEMEEIKHNNEVLKAENEKLRKSNSHETLRVKIQKLSAENERLTNRLNVSTDCINNIDDLFEYAFKSLAADRLQDRVHKILATYTENLTKQSRGE